MYSCNFRNGLLPAEKVHAWRIRRYGVILLLTGVSYTYRKMVVRNIILLYLS